VTVQLGDVPRFQRKAHRTTPYRPQYLLKRRSHQIHHQPGNAAV